MAQPVKYDLLTVLRSLFESEMDFPTNPPRVFVYNQPYRIPPDEGMFGLVSFLGSVPFGSASSYQDNPDTGELDEVQTVNIKEMYQFDLWSANAEAELRKEEPIFALKSYTAQSLCEQYSFSIGQLPTAMLDVSHIEASRRINRYSMTFNCLREISRTRSIPFFSQFKQPATLIQQ